MSSKKLMWVNLPLFLPMTLMFGMSATVALADSSGGSGTGGATGPVIVAKAEPKPTLPAGLCDAAKIKAKTQSEENLLLRKYVETSYYNGYWAEGQADQCALYSSRIAFAALTEFHSNKDNELLIEQFTAGTLAQVGQTLMNERLDKAIKNALKLYGQAATKNGCAEIPMISTYADTPGSAPALFIQLESKNPYYESNPIISFRLKGSFGANQTNLVREVNRYIGRKMTKDACMDKGKKLSCERSADLNYAMVHHWGIPESCIQPMQVGGEALAGEVKKQPASQEPAPAPGEASPFIAASAKAK